MAGVPQLPAALASLLLAVLEARPLVQGRAPLLPPPPPQVVVVLLLLHAALLEGLQVTPISVNFSESWRHFVARTAHAKLSWRSSQAALQVAFYQTA